jgi:hypothetical protein
MAFDQPTRNRLQRFVSDARDLLTKEFTRQLQQQYGLDPKEGSVRPLVGMRDLDDARRETARTLRETLEHYAKTDTAVSKQDLLQRIVREQAFTVLNRLAALRMAEARGILIQSVGNGYDSKGFQLYARLAGTGLGETGDAYRSYLFSIFDEFALDLKVLFDRFSPMGRLFPGNSALIDLLSLINDSEIAPLWAEDETIGWIYQYFNSKEERKKMRDESAAPRNSRELAVRNQFFTPRYVVQFLTDNTLGRIWYEMTRGQSNLVDQCQYLVRRPKEILLGDPESAAKHLGIEVEATAIHETVKAAYRGDFSSAASEEVGGYREWIALAIPPDQYEKVTGLPFTNLTDFEHLSNVWRVLDEEPTSPYLRDPAWVLAGLSQFVLTGSGGPYAIKPFERLWDAFKSAATHPPADDPPQEELLKQPAYIPHRKKKDPREILMLDPACGSMHFGLYAVDLFETIYEEAWEQEEADPKSFARSEHLKPLHEIYADKQAFQRDVPRLIIENNIHGIDIDPRAVQIAGLSLWLRAQRSWHQQGVKGTERPQIRRSNIVCAEPMPGERDLLEEFIEKQLSSTAELRLIGQLVRRVFEAMKLAGEAGSLLKIEENIATAIDEAKREWQKGPKAEQQALIAGARAPEQKDFNFDIRGITDAEFWEKAEARIYQALADYAEHAENGGGFLRRLFAEDAAQGFAFIDLYRKRYDVAVMNPPFGEFSSRWKSNAAKIYPDTRNDIFAALTERMLEVLRPRGYVGTITSRTGFFLTSFYSWRKNILREKANLRCLADLGGEVMDDAMVESAAYCLEKSPPQNNVLFIRTLISLDREQILGRSVSGINVGEVPSNVFFPFVDQFDKLPDSPFVYWSNQRALEALSSWPTLKDAAGDVRQGLATADDPRFARAIWEAPYADRRYKDNGKAWVPYVKAGASQPWFSPITLLVNWGGNAAELWANLNAQGNVRSNIWMLKDAIRLYFFKPGFSWTRRAARFIPYVIPEGCIPSASRYLAFPHADKTYSLMGLSASNASSIFLRFYGEWFQRPNYMVESVKLLPWPILSRELSKRLQAYIESQVRARRRTYQNYEPFHEFTLPHKVWTDGLSLDALYFDYFSLLGSDLDQEISDVYGLTEEDIRSVGLDLREALLYRQSSSEDDEESEGGDLLIDASNEGQCESLLSYALGCTLGRWDIRLATGEKPIPELADPFEPLPVCPPGMLQNEEGLPAGPEDLSKSYPLRISWPGILVEDHSHAEDIERRVREALQAIWPERADAIEQEACEILGVRSLREYFRRPNLFFADHHKRYSKSRRQAPIYWPLSTSSGSYTLWLYYHRLSDQTLFTCVNDFVEPKLRQVTDALNDLRAKGSRSRDEEKEYEGQQDFEVELREFRDELLRIANLPWKPNLNDGVQITAAPLWKLFRLPKWQKTLRETWQKLEKGDYDWAHLAMTTWPERVVPKCIKDRSIAIAHGLEDLFWVKDADGWRKLRRLEQEIEEQKKLQRSDARVRVKLLLTKLAASEEGTLNADEVCRRLAGGEWDDCEVALLLYPQRVADACWEDPTIARRLNIQLPTRRTNAARQQFTKKLIKSGCPDIASKLESALRDRGESFRALWEAMERGDHDDFEVAIAFWPERVVVKCAEDVTMAERHGIRRFLWVQHPSDEWRRRLDPEKEIEFEVSRRRGPGNQ